MKQKYTNFVCLRHPTYTHFLKLLGFRALIFKTALFRFLYFSFLFFPRTSQGGGAIAPIDPPWIRHWYKLSLSTEILDSRRFKASGAIFITLYIVWKPLVTILKYINSLARLQVTVSTPKKKMFYLLPVMLDTDKNARLVWISWIT